MSKMNHSDLRLYARFDFIECAMLYAERTPEPYRVMLVDIGLGGVQLRSKDIIPVEEKLILHIGQNGAVVPLKLVGKVRYCHDTDEDGMYISGFKFMPESHQERVEIAEFVHEVFQKQWEILAS